MRKRHFTKVKIYTCVLKSCKIWNIIFLNVFETNQKRILKTTENFALPFCQILFPVQYLFLSAKFYFQSARYVIFRLQDMLFSVCKICYFLCGQKMTFCRQKITFRRHFRHTMYCSAFCVVVHSREKNLTRQWWF